MARRKRRPKRYRRKGRIDPIRAAILGVALFVIFLVWIIVQIVRFLSENPWVIYTILGLGALVLAGWIDGPSIDTNSIKKRRFIRKRKRLSEL